MAAVLSTASLDGAAVIINQLTAASHRDGATPVVERASGNIDPALIGISLFEPITSLTTKDVLTALGISGLLTAGYYCEDESILSLNSRANGAVKPVEHPIQHPECVINAFKNQGGSHGKF